MFSRILYGGRISLTIGLLGVMVSFVLGVIIGGIAGYYGGKVDLFVQRLIEIETYRMLALLGLPEAQRLAPSVRATEEALVRIAGTMTQTDGLAADIALLDEMTALAAPMQSEAASANYRYGASRAYDDIVRERVKMLDETPVPGFETLGSFLQRRLAPAMRTCQSVEERQANLSRKLSRATGLVRSWIDVELERQNSVLLTSMDRRANLQLRLQQTVEGLSVAAISYYVVGLFGYLAKWLETEGFPIKSSTLTGLSVPVVILGIWWTVCRSRHHHRDTGD